MGFSKHGIYPLIWNLGTTIRHEKIPATHILDTLLTGNAWLFDEKKCDINKLRSLDFFRSSSHRFNCKFTLNLCDAQVYKTKNSEMSC